VIRLVTIASLSALLLLVLYLPSAHPPTRFIEQVRLEHQQAESLWGVPAADRILERSVTFSAQAAHASPVPSRDAGLVPRSEATPVRDEMERVNRRLFDNPYFRSIDALLFLATYRLSSLLEWLPKSLFLVLGLVADAALERVVKSKEFRQHDPEMYALYLSTAILGTCSLVLCLVLPWTMHPLAWALAPLGIAFLAARAIADFHRRP
jgi:hypothetical protein